MFVATAVVFTASVVFVFAASVVFAALVVLFAAPVVVFTASVVVCLQHQSERLQLTESGFRDTTYSLDELKHRERVSHLTLMVDMLTLRSKCEPLIQCLFLDSKVSSLYPEMYLHGKFKITTSNAS